MSAHLLQACCSSLPIFAYLSTCLAFVCWAEAESACYLLVGTEQSHCTSRRVSTTDQRDCQRYQDAHSHHVESNSQLRISNVMRILYCQVCWLFQGYTLPACTTGWRENARVWGIKAEQPRHLLPHSLIACCLVHMLV